MRRILVAPFRRATQLASFALLAPWLLIGWLRCPFGVPFVSCGGCSVRNCPGTWLQPWVLIGIVVGHLLRPRFFCGWVCPLGFLQDAIGSVLGRRGRPTGILQARADRAARWTKYGVLAATAAAFYLLDAGPGRPYDFVVRSLRVLDLEAVRIGAALGLWRYTVRAGLLAVALAGGVFIARFWCRYLCPLGAAMALVARLSPGRLRVVRERCTGCGACTRVCPLGTRPGTGECVSGHECSDACRFEAIRAAPGTRRGASGEAALDPGPVGKDGAL